MGMFWQAGKVLAIVHFLLFVVRLFELQWLGALGHLVMGTLLATAIRFHDRLERLR